MLCIIDNKSKQEPHYWVFNHLLDNSRSMIIDDINNMFPYHDVFRALI